MKEIISFANHSGDHCADLQARLSCALGAMRRHFPHVTTWSVSSSEPALVVNLPEEVSAPELLEWADCEGVSFAPGSRSGVERERRDTICLHLSHLEESEIEEGIRKLGGLVVRYMDLASRVDGRVSPACFFGP